MVSKETIILGINVILFLVYIINYCKKDGASLRMKRYIMLISTICSFLIGAVPGIISLLVMITMELRYRGGGNSIVGPLVIFALFTGFQQVAYMMMNDGINIELALRNLYSVLNIIIYIIEAKTYIIVKRVELKH